MTWQTCEWSSRNGAETALIDNNGINLNTTVTNCNISDNVNSFEIQNYQLGNTSDAKSSSTGTLWRILNSNTDTTYKYNYT